MTRLFAILLTALSLHAADKISVISLDNDPRTGSARAVIVDNVPLVHTTQILPVDSKGEIVHKNDAAGQTADVLRSLEAILKETAKGANLGTVVKLNVYAANDDVVSIVQKHFAKEFKKENRPAATYVISKLSNPDALVAIDAIATSKETSITTVQRHHWNAAHDGKEFAQAAVLPQGGVVYISGQAIKGPLPEATLKTLEQLDATLKFLKLEKNDVVSAKAFVQPATEAETVKKGFAKFFEGNLVPPLSIVDWTSGKDLPIEIELVVAARGTGADAKESISYLCPPFMTGSPVYSKIARVNSGKLVYLSGITGKSKDSAEAEIHEIFADLKEIAQKAGSDMDHLAKATYYVSNPQTSARLNEIRPKYYNPKTPPAASKASVKGVGWAGKGITFDMIAVAPK